MSTSDWITVDEACDILVDRRLDGFARDRFLPARQFAWRMVLASLADGSLAARSLAPESFSLLFDSSSETKLHALEAEAVIPQLFWLHFEEAQEKEKLEPLMAARESFAEQLNGNFKFKLSEGLRDGGTLTGEARSVVIQRSGLPGDLPKPRGRRVGSRIDDRAVVDRAFDAIESGRMTPKQAVMHFAPQMPGGASLPASKAKRLRERLRIQRVQLGE